MLMSQKSVRQAAGLSMGRIIVPVLLGLAVTGVSAVTAVINARLFSELLGPRRVSQLEILVLLLALLLIARPILDSLLLQSRVVAGARIKSSLRANLLEAIDKRGPMRNSQGRAGQIQSVISDGVEATEAYYINYSSQLIITAISVAAILGAIFWCSPLAATVLGVCAISVVVIPRVWDAALADKGQEHWGAYEEMNADFIDAMMGMNTLKAFGAADDYGKQLEQQSERLLTSTLGQLRLSLGESGLSGAMKVLGPAIALLITIGQVRSGSLSWENLFLVTMLAMEVFKPFGALSAAWHESFFGISAVCSMEPLLAEPAVKSNSYSLLRSKQSIYKSDASILFQNVNYSYNGAKGQALCDISLRIESGKTTAIVGSSGCGKSTLLGLMMGFDIPDSGAVAFGECDPRAIDITRSITLVPQEPMLFPGTLRRVVQCGDSSIDDATLLEALDKTQALSIFNDRNKDDTNLLDMHIDERGSNLSGGQRQRVAIARGLVRNTPVLVLDESTSALDTLTESKVLEGIREMSPSLTLILVTHRLDTAAKADSVIVMENGGISCAGSPGDLLIDEESAWAKLVAAQKIRG